MNNLPYQIPRREREPCLREAMAIAHWSYCEQLDCTVSAARQPTNLSREQVLGMGLQDVSTMFHFVRRDGYPCDGPLCENGYYDVGLSTLHLNQPDYFLWIKLTLEQGQRLIDKYGLFQHQINPAYKGN